MRTFWPLLIALLIAPMVAAWPLPTAWTSRWVSDPFGEAVVHTWGLWSAAAHGHPFLLNTTTIAWPDGITAVLADPLNLIWFSLGWPAGAESAYNTVVYGNLLILGFSGIILARSVGGNPYIGLTAAVFNPSTLGAVTGGITEVLPIGWLGLFWVSLLRSLQPGQAQWAWPAGIILALCVFGGPYLAVWAALSALPIGVFHLARSGRQALRPLLIAAGVGIGLSAPLTWSILTGRVAGQPGTSDLAKYLLHPPAASSSIFRGGVRFGADLSDPLLPLPLTGGQAEPTFTAYLGLAAVIMACCVLARRRSLWPWLLGSAFFSVLSLGPWVVWMGSPATVDGLALHAPVGWLATHFEAIGRISHWNRAGGASALLLVPLVSLFPSVWPRAAAAPLAIGLLLVDRIVGSPVPWPMPTFRTPDMAAHAEITNSDGAILVQPNRFHSHPLPQAKYRDPALLAQFYHQHVVSEPGVMGHGLSDAARHAHEVLERIARQGQVEAEHRLALQGPGFRWLAVYHRHMSDDPERDARWARCIGAPVAEDDWVTLYDLSVGIHPVCVTGRPPSAAPPSPEGPGTF